MSPPKTTTKKPKTTTTRKATTTKKPKTTTSHKPMTTKKPTTTPKPKPIKKVTAGSETSRELKKDQGPLVRGITAEVPVTVTKDDKITDKQTGHAPRGRRAGPARDRRLAAAGRARPYLVRLPRE
ncbi:hypothetical protein [Streptomyces rimosus]|uniref:hypothetical protein n=1 Tax=Streptomyces rimosus TaxID=1927 RepID=UPI0037D92722